MLRLIPCRAVGLQSLLILALLGGLGVTANAENVKLAAMFSDHMVLQRDMNVPVWGVAGAGDKISVQFAGQTKNTKADKNGHWKVELDKLSVGQPQTLTVKGTNTITVSDVLVGEVWLCSGQSNMAFNVKGADNFNEEKTAAQYPQIRQFMVQSAHAKEPQSECKGSWVVCSPETVGGFSAAAYFFGRELHKKLGVPVGLINSSVGGTPIESWTSLEAQQKSSEISKGILEPWDKRIKEYDPSKAQAALEKQAANRRAAAEKAKAEGKAPPAEPKKSASPLDDNHRPGTLFNGKINPLAPYAIRGAIWYQGESNANGLANIYGEQLKTMITDWRTRWGYDFAFGWVQLPDFHAPQKMPVEQDGWVEVREGMLKTLSLPKTGMAVTLGLGMPANIHPTNKQGVGKRLGAWALADVYGEKGLEGSGPMLTGHEVRGSEIVLSFSHAAGLKAQNGELKGFAIAGDDKKWVWGNAKIDGDKVIVSSPEVGKPTAVRYAWAANPQFSLVNGAGLVASPFRTDDAGSDTKPK